MLMLTTGPAPMPGDWLQAPATQGDTDGPPAPPPAPPPRVLVGPDDEWRAFLRVVARATMMVARALGRYAGPEHRSGG